MTPIDQFIADPATPDCVRRFLQWARFEAANDERPPPLFANLDDCRVRVVTAYRTGFVGVTARLGSVAPRRFVSLNDLTAFLDSPYPRIWRSRAQLQKSKLEDSESLVSHILNRLGFADVTAFGLKQNMDARLLAVAELHLAGADNSTAGRLLGLNRFLVRIALEKTGLGGEDSEDRRIVRAIWRNGPIRIGTAPGCVTAEKARHLQSMRWIVVDHGRCEVAVRHLFAASAQRRAA
jgi:hypothetical protein